MIRILQVAECAKGGVPLFVRNVAEGLRGEFEFGVVCPPSSELCLRPPAGVAVLPLPMAHSLHPLKDPLCALLLARMVRAGRYDIVHLNSSKAGIIGALAGGSLRARTVFTPHALRSRAYREGSPWRAAARWVEKAICRRADAIVAVSVDEQRQLIEEGIATAQKVRLIENGVDLELLSAPPSLSRQSIGIPEEAFVVGTVGRLSPQKDPLLFAWAASIVARAIPEAHFVMVGDGPLEQAVLEHAASDGLSERLGLLGWRADAAEILKLFDVFVLVSRYEGMPFALLEAAAASKPLVCTAAPGVRSLVTHGENGLLVEVGDWRGVAAAVVQLYGQRRLRSRLGAAASHTIARPRSLETMLKAWGLAYRSLLEEVTGAPAPANLAVADQ